METAKKEMRKDAGDLSVAMSKLNRQHAPSLEVATLPVNRTGKLDDSKGLMRSEILEVNGEKTSPTESNGHGDMGSGGMGERKRARSVLISPVTEDEPLMFKMDEDGSESGEPKLAEEIKSSSCSESESPARPSTLGRYMEERKNSIDVEQADASDCDNYGYPPLRLNYEALQHIATHYLPGDHGQCVAVSELAKGTNHEILVLRFQDGWSCIGRFVRTAEALEKAESEIATMKYVREHTTIPVPEIYFTSFNENHVVGAPFIFMELLPGQHLYQLWDDMSLDHKLHVIYQITDVVAQLDQLEFGCIGSLQASGVGPLLSQIYAQEKIGKGPFLTMEEYMLSFKPEQSDCTDEMHELNGKIAKELRIHMRSQGQNPLLSAPYRLIHGNFDTQNLIFLKVEPKEPPKLCGIIDWDYSYTGPLYELYDYPIFIQDVHWSENLYAENKILRQNFVRSLASRFPKGSVRRLHVQKAFREKSYLLENFANAYASAAEGAEVEAGELRRANRALETLQTGGSLPYKGRVDWQPDEEIEIEDD